MKQSFQKFQTVSGQLTLLGLVFICAVVLGVAIVCLRDRVFERYSREKYPPLDGYAAEASRVLVNPSSSAEQVEEVGKQLRERIQAAARDRQRASMRFNDLEGLYGAWMQDEAFDPTGSLAQRLTHLQPDWVFQRLRVTLVAGSHNQELRTLAWLRFVAGNTSEGGSLAQFDELAEYARRKAQHRGDREFEQLADAVIALGCPRGGFR